MRRAGVGGDENIEKAVVIDIGVSRAPRHSRSGKGSAHLRRHFLKLTSAKVAKQMRRLGIADTLLHALDGVFDVAIGDENIGPAVVVVIEEEAAEAERNQCGAADFRLRSFIDEQAVTFVVIERDHLIREVGNDDAGPAAAGVVGGVDSHAGAGNSIFTESYSRWNSALLEATILLVQI